MKAKYYIYRNLHKEGHFSIKHRGKVIKHTQAISAFMVDFRVSECGRQRAIETGQRNVHAFVVAEWYNLEDDINDLDLSLYREVTYNPFKNSSFVYKDTGKPIKNVFVATLYKGKLYV